MMMPKMDGYELCRRIKQDSVLKHTPVIMLTGKAEISMRVEGLELGADDYLTKPFNSRELLARVSNLIEMREMEKQLAEYSRHLEEKVKVQVDELERKRRLERYLSPQIVESILTQGQSLLASSQRKNLTVMFTDIRGFTALSDSMEPEETIQLLNDYLREMSKVIFSRGGTIDKFLGDGIMVFFGDPIPQEDHAFRAISCALEMNRRLLELQKDWFLPQGKGLSIGIGINTGYMTVGNIGSESRMEYTVIGNQVNLAARLQGLAGPGEIIITHSTYGQVKELVEAEQKGEVEIKGLARPVLIYKVSGVKNEA